MPEKSTKIKQFAHANTSKEVIIPMKGIKIRRIRRRPQNAPFSNTKTSKTLSAPNRSLRDAAIEGNDQKVLESLRQGADINNTQHYHRTPLMMAAKHGHLTTVTLLLANKANIDATSSGNQTPLMFAAAAGHTAIVEKLLAHGANTELQNLAGETALMYAAKNSHRASREATIKALILGGAHCDLSRLIQQSPKIRQSPAMQKYIADCYMLALPLLLSKLLASIVEEYSEITGEHIQNNSGIFNTCNITQKTCPTPASQHNVNENISTAGVGKTPSLTL